MRYILFILILTAQIGSAQMVTQPGLRDYQISAAALPDSILYILGTDTTGSKIGLGKWYRGDSLANSLGDHDFYGLNTGRPAFAGEDSIETALDSMYVLFKGLTGGLATKIEMLQNGILQFDTEEGLSNRVFARIRPLKYSDGEPDWNFGLETSSGTSAKNNSIFWGGWNLSPGGTRTTGTGTAFGFSFEDHFSPALSLHAAEAHLVVFIDSSGVMTRPVSFLFDKGDNTTWRGDFLMRSFALNDPVNEDPYANFDGTTTQSTLRLLGSSSGTGVELFLDAANNNFQISNYGMTSPFLFANTFYGTVVNKLNVQSFESTPDQLIGLNSGDKYVGQVTLGSGLQLTGGSLVASFSQAFHEVGTSTPPNAITDDIFKSSGKVGIGETTPANILEVVAASADSDESILRLSGGASGFSGNNEADNEHSIIFDLCAFNGSITQQSAGQIGVKKEGSWNESSNGFPGIPASLVFKTQSGSVASPDLSTKMTIASDGEITLNEYTTSNFNGGVAADSVLVVTSAGVVKKRNASAFTGGSDTDDQNLTIEGAGPTYDIAINDGTDVTIANLYGLTLSESPANTLNFQVDSSKLATQFDISGFGTMSNWLLAASGTGGTETITNGETVTVSETTGLDVTRSTNTVAVALSIDEFSTDAAAEGDELMLAYDPSGTNHELFDINNLPYIATEVDGSTTNEAWTVDADGGDTEVISNQTLLFDGTGIVTTTYTSGTNTLAIGATEVDGSVTNEAWTIDGDIGSVPEVITTQTVLFTGAGGIQTDWDGVNNELIIDASGVTGTGDGDGIYDGSGTVPTTTVATLTDNLTFSVGASEADLFIDGTNDLIGIGTNSPEQQLTISNEDSNISYPIMAFHTDQTGSVSAFLGRQEFLYGSEALAVVSVQKATSTTSNDAVYMIDMMDSGGGVEPGLDLKIEDTYAKNRPRMTLYGAMQHASVDSIGANTTLDESYFAVRCTTATITITLPNANTTNNEWIGTQYWIYNDSGGDITIDPNGANDTVNGSSSNITVADNAGYYLMLMSTTASGVNNWMALKTP